MTDSQSEPMYISLRDSSCIDSDERTFRTTPSTSTLFVQSFRLNAWFFVALILWLKPIWEGMLFPSVPDEGVIWATPDFDHSKLLFKSEKRRFTNAIRDDSDGSLISSWDKNEPQYTGFPNTEVDKNWNELIGGRYFRLEEPEVSLLNLDTTLPKLSNMPRGGRIPKEGVYGGPDVLHSLHCLNAIRKHLNLDYYAKSMTLPPEYRQMHLDHCVDHLRQALLCCGDLTPVTLKPVLANTSLPYPVTFYLGQTEREHTCRNSEAIKNWVSRRGQRTGRILSPISEDMNSVNE